jgi:hypothetical protein
MNPELMHPDTEIRNHPLTPNPKNPYPNFPRPPHQGDLGEGMMDATPQNFNFKPLIRNPSTPNPTPLDPKPKTLHPKPKTLNNNSQRP